MMGCNERQPINDMSSFFHSLEKKGCKNPIRTSRTHYEPSTNAFRMQYEPSTNACRMQYERILNFFQYERSTNVLVMTKIYSWWLAELARMVRIQFELARVFVHSCWFVLSEAGVLQLHVCFFYKHMKFRIRARLCLAIYDLRLI